MEDEARNVYREVQDRHVLRTADVCPQWAFAHRTSGHSSWTLRVSFSCRRPSDSDTCWQMAPVRPSSVVTSSPEADQRSYGEDELVLGGEGVGAGGHFVVHDLVGQAHAADVLLVASGSVGCVVIEPVSLVIVDALTRRIGYRQPMRQVAARCFVSHVASPNLG